MSFSNPKRRLSVLIGVGFLAWLFAGCGNPAPGRVEASGDAVAETSEPESEAVAEPAPVGSAAPEAPARPEAAPSASPEKPAVAPARPAPRAEPVSESPAAAAAPAKEKEVEAAPPVDVPKKVFVEIPAGTVLELELLTSLDSSVNRVGDTIQAHTASPVYVAGKQVLGAGAYVEGRITEAKASGKVKGRASLGFTFDRLQTAESMEEIRSSYVEREAADGKKKDAAVIGGSAGLGAIVGAIIGGKKGAAIGATIGGAGGAGVVLTTKGEEIRVPVGTLVNVRLDDPVTIPLH